MNREAIKKLLEEIRAGERSVAEGIDRLKHLPYESLGFATLDHHRSVRQGFPEAVFCEGKTERQVLEILEKMEAAHTPLLATRAAPALAVKILEKFPNAEYRPLGRVVLFRSGSIQRRAQGGTQGGTQDGTLHVLHALHLPPVGEVALITAGTADLPVAEEAKGTAEFLGYRVAPFYDVGVAGLHRLLDQKEKMEQADVVIVVAGMDGALASVVGGLFGQPVIAVPTSAGYGTSFEGVSALLAMLNSCAAGLAVVNIDNGFGAATLAHRIL